jgi:putative hydrolase of the HAD superfamily
VSASDRFTSGALDAVLFDAGGTLVRLDYELMARCVERCGAQISIDGLHLAEARARGDIDRRARAAGGVHDSDAERVHDYFETLLDYAGAPADVVRSAGSLLREEHARRNLWRVVCDGAHETLAAIRALGLRVAVVSNADGRVEGILRSLDLHRYLDLVVDSHHEGVEKPDPEIFRRALDRLGVPAARAAYVGDIYSIDGLGARAAGLYPVIVDATRTYRGHDCDTIADLRQLIARLGT